MWRAEQSYRELFDEIARHEVSEALAESAGAMRGDWNGEAYNPPAAQQPGVYAWGEAHLQWAYVLQYEATGDVGYLDVFTRRFRALLALRDDAAGRRDELRQCMMPAWGSVRFSHGISTCWLVHAGIITYPAARFLRLTAGLPDLQARYASEIAEFRTALAETVNAYDPWWHDGPSADEGYYTEPAMPDDSRLPLNQQNLLGRTMLELVVLPEFAGYRSRVTRLARFLKRRLLVRPDGAYQWAYRPPLLPPYDQAGAEDISHAAMNADFVVRCFQEGIVFTAEDLTRFARTFTQVICQPDGRTAEHVDGSGAADTYRNILAFWGRLALIDPAIAEKIRTVFFAMDPPARGAMALHALAMLGWLAREGRIA